MIIGGHRAQCDNEGGGRCTMLSCACRQSDPRCNLLQREQGGEKGRGKYASFVCNTIWSLDGLTMKLSTTKRRQQPVVRGDLLLGGDIDAEQELKHRKRCDTGSAGSPSNHSWWVYCKWNMIADFSSWYELQCSSLMFNVGLNKRTVYGKQSGGKVWKWKFAPAVWVCYLYVCVFWHICVCTVWRACLLHFKRAVESLRNCEIRWSILRSYLRRTGLA